MVTSTADVVVLGGGIIGCAVTRRLARRGLDVLLVEAAPGVGTGASGRCDGNLLVQTKDDPLLVELTRRGIAEYRAWCDELDGDIGFRRDGSLVLAADAATHDAADARRRVLADRGVAADLLDAPTLRAAEPRLAHDLAGALSCAEDAEVYPPGVVAALVVDARRHGARLRTGVAAHALVVGPDGAVRGVDTSAGRVGAPQVVNALGVAAPQLVVPAGVPVPPVRPRHGVLVATATAPDLLRHNVREARYLTDRAEGTPDDGVRVSFAAEPTHHGNLLLGSSRRFSGHDRGVPPAVVARILDRAARFLPAVRRLGVLRAFSGLRPWTPDGLPVIGPAAGAPGYVLACGHEGEGIGLAPATAALVEAAVCGEDGDDSDAAARWALSPDRFERVA